MKKTLILAAAFACAAFSANAAIFVDTWSGTTWTAANQPGFSGGNGVITPNASSTGDSSLNVTGAYDRSLQGEFFYTLFTLPTFTFSSDATWSGVTQVKLEVLHGGFAIDNNALLSFDGQAGLATSSFSRVAAEGVDNPFSDEAFLSTYIWNFGSAQDLADFNLAFSTTSHHTAIFDITLTVDAIAVPEPSTYALIAGAFGLAAVVIARRRRA